MLCCSPTTRRREQLCFFFISSSEIRPPLTQRVRNENVDRCDQPHEARHRVHLLRGRIEAVVVVTDQHKVDHRQQEAGECDQIGRHPARKELHAPVPERVHHVHAEYASVDAVVLARAKSQINKSVSVIVRNRERSAGCFGHKVQTLHGINIHHTTLDDNAGRDPL